MGTYIVYVGMNNPTQPEGKVVVSDAADVYIALDRKNIAWPYDRHPKEVELSICLLWNSEMDDTTGSSYMANHIKATGEFPSDGEMKLCCGVLQLGTGHDGVGQELEECFNNIEELRAAYRKLKDHYDRVNDGRAWRRLTSIFNARPGLATLRVQCDEGTISEKNLFFLALSDGWTIGWYRFQCRRFGFKPFF